MNLIIIIIGFNMGNDNSSNSGGNSGGLDSHCYNVGYDHGSQSNNDAIGDGILGFHVQHQYQQIKHMEMGM